MEGNPANSATKSRQTNETLRKMAGRAVGSFTDFSAHELAGGMCNAVYLVETDGRRSVVKIAPDDSVRVMRHERNILETEAKMLKKFGEKLSIPAPRLLLYDDSRELCAQPYLFMSFVQGASLLTLEPKPPETKLREIKREVGKICREISSLGAPAFGIPALPETFREKNSEFVSFLFQMLLDDAADKNVRVPGTRDGLVELIDSFKTELDEAVEPCHTHTDTWNGNLMVEHGKLAGLVDFAAILYADPLMTHDFHDFSPATDFCKGFGKTNFTHAERIRIKIYEVWQRLGMIVERGFRGYDDPNTYSWVLDAFSKSAAELAAMRHE